MSKFDPSAHFMDLKGKKYLPVAARLQWFREEHADWGIITSAEVLEFEQGYAVFRASILNAEGRIIATATKAETRKDFMDFAEKAETGSIGRALAFCGYGTQFAQDLEEGERLADTPQLPKQRPESAGDRRATQAVQRNEQAPSYAAEAVSGPKEPNPRGRYHAMLKEHALDGMSDAERHLLNGILIGKHGTPIETSSFGVRNGQHDPKLEARQWKVLLDALESHCDPKECAGGAFCDLLQAAKDEVASQTPEQGYTSALATP